HARARRLGVLEPAGLGVRGRRRSGRAAPPPGGVADRGGRVDDGQHRVRLRERGTVRGGGRGGRTPAGGSSNDPRVARPLRQDGGAVPALRVLSLYPELMNIYADRGNIAVLKARCEWRGLGFEHAATTLGDRFDPSAHDLFYMGGGQDRDQVAVAHDMEETKRDSLHAAADRGAVVLAVCGGYQLLGHYYEMGDEELPGVGLVDMRTVREPGPRRIGNCAIEADLGTGPRVIAGFENHGGRTYLGTRETPLGRVLGGQG